MRATLTQPELAGLVAKAAKALSSRSTLPVLSNLLLQARDDGMLAVTGTNFAMRIEAIAPVLIEEPGAITLPGDLLQEWVKNMPKSESIQVIVNGDYSAKMSCGRSETTIKGIDAGDFPMPLFVTPNTEVRLKSGTLRQLSARVSYAASRNESQPALTAVYVKAANRKLAMVATDGFRLAMDESDIDTDTAWSALLPRPFMAVLERLTEDKDEEQVFIRLGDSSVCLEWSDLRATSQLVEARYPAYDAIIPKECKGTAIANAGELLTALKVTGLFLKEDNSRAVLEFSEKGLVVRGQGSETGDCQTTVAVNYVGPEIKIGINTAYTIQALRSVEDQDVELRLVNDKRPMLIKQLNGGTYVAVISPMEVR